MELDIRSFLLDRQAQGASPKTLHWYKNTLLKFYTWLDANEHSQKPSDWSSILLREYIHHLQTSITHKGTRLSPSSVSTYANAVLVFTRWLFHEQVITTDITLRVKKPRIPDQQKQPFNDVELRKLITAAKESRYPLRDYAMVCLLIDCALRASELRTLSVEDVLLNQMLVVVQHGKGLKSRVVPMSVQTAKAVRTYLQIERNNTKTDVDILFLSQHGTPLTLSGVGQFVKRIASAAGVEGAYPHRFRHTSAILFLRNGGNVFALQKILGHSDLSMTRRYVNLVTDDLAKAHESASPLKGLL